ncbi:MAG: HIT family protein [Betaproteobacteria bacterium]|jgi:diadenosine tetraphosphate (Ap4A) HIT family hydrolase
MACDLCSTDGGMLVLRNDDLRVVLVDDADHPGFSRVIWNAHVREMTDLQPPQIARLMDAVFAVEHAVRTVLAPHKINLASLGNLTPHLHWHVIPRYETDAHFPRPVWAERLREEEAAARAARRVRLDALAAEIRARLPAAPAA